MRDCPVLTPPKVREPANAILRMRLELGGIDGRVANASGMLTGHRPLLLAQRAGNTSPKAQDEGLPCSNSGLKRANRIADPSHAIGTRGIGGPDC